MKCTVFFIGVLAIFTLDLGVKQVQASNCDSCLTIVDLAVQVLSTGISPDQITAIGEVGCGMVPEVVRKVCPGVVQDIYDNIYDILMVQQQTGEDLCAQAKMC